MKNHLPALAALALLAACQPTTPAARINTPAAKTLLHQPATEVLDVRTPDEYAAGHLPTAQNINVSADDFAQRTASLDTSKTYVLYCHSGKRSAKAADVMRGQGFRHLVNGGAYDSLKTE